MFATLGLLAVRSWPCDPGPAIYRARSRARAAPAARPRRGAGAWQHPPPRLPVRQDDGGRRRQRPV